MYSLKTKRCTGGKPDPTRAMFGKFLIGIDFKTCAVSVLSCQEFVEKLTHILKTARVN